MVSLIWSLSPLDNPSRAGTIPVCHRSKHERLLHFITHPHRRNFKLGWGRDTQPGRRQEVQQYGSESFGTGTLVWAPRIIFERFENASPFTHPYCSKGRRSSGMIRTSNNRISTDFHLQGIPNNVDHQPSILPSTPIYR